MRMMTKSIKKTLMLMVALVATTAFAACGGDDDGAGGATVTGMKISKTTLNFTKDGGTEKVSVQAPVQASATADAPWLTVTVGTMSANMKVTPVTITADANTTETNERTATVTVTAGTEVQTISITQEAAESKSDDTETPVTPSQPSAITANAMQIAKQMYPGWNLGNTMEGGNNANNWTNNAGLNAETSWQSTKTSQAIIDFVKQQGFRSVRIPTAWVMGHITDKENVTIDPAWLARVKEIVDYCTGDGLYVFINDHWDGGWLEDSFSDVSDATVAANSEKLKKLWTQIAEYFRDYDEHLLFAGLNEPYVHGEVTTGMVSALIKYEQAFIDAVRATGGNNAKRTLIVQGPQTDIDKTNQYYDVSRLTDPAGSGYLMVEVHYYAPWNFAGMESDESWGKCFYYWGADNHVSGSSHNANYGEESDMNAQFQKMKTKFADKGYPVIVGEYGCMWRNLSTLSGESQEKHDASVKLFYKCVNQYAPSNGLIPFVWGTNYCNQNGTKGGYTVLNRATLKVFNEPAMQGITEGSAAAQWPY